MAETITRELFEMEIEKRANFALELGKKAEEIILPYFQNKKTSIELKSDTSAVTQADREAEKFIRSEIEKYYPDDGIIGEEFGIKKSGSDYTWSVDPIDGTQSFVCGVPLYGTMIGLVEKDESVMGCVHFPSLEMTIYAYKGFGTWWKPKGQSEFIQAKVKNHFDPNRSVVSTSGPDYFKRAGMNNIYEKLVTFGRHERTWGDCYGYFLLATGQIDLMADGPCGAWDCIPLAIIIREAGGTFCDLSGGHDLSGKNGLLAVSSALSHDILKIL